MTMSAESTHVSLGAARWLPLGGVAYGLLQIAGDLTIGDFPDGGTSPHDLVSWYAAHHEQVVAGGTLMALSAVGLALFAAGVVVRIRSSVAAASVVAIGGAMAAVDAATGASSYAFLGDISTEKGLNPIGLQALHQLGSGGGVTASVLVLTAGLLMAAVDGRRFPMWLAVTGMALGIAAFTPFGFLASMLFLLWSVVAGIALTIQTARNR